VRWTAIALTASFYTVPEVARVLRLNAWTVYRKVEAGELRAVRTGRARNAPIRILAADLADYLRDATLRTSDPDLAAELEQLRKNLRAASEERSR
jgi:excisionase family DNA binding protein